MKVVRVVSVVLSLALVFCLQQPFAYASENEQSSDSYIIDDFAYYGFDDENALYNIIVSLEDRTVQFALTYKADQNKLYEYEFLLPDTISFDAPLVWENITDICFNNAENWKSVNVSDAVYIETNSMDETSMRAVDEHKTYFTDWLAEQNGNPIDELFFSSQIMGGVMFSRYFMRQNTAYVSYRYILTQTLSVAGFLTGVVGLALSPTLMAVFSTIIGAGGLVAGSTVTQYTLRTINCYYITADGGTYPYSMVDYFIYYTGYVYSETNGHGVDTASRYSFYDPSEHFYLAATEQFNTAYSEYLRLGWLG